MKRTIYLVDNNSSERLLKQRRLNSADDEERKKWRRRYDVVMDELKDPRMYKDFILDQLLEEEEEYLELECYYESMDIAEVEQDIADFFKTLE